jgi:hypothetical protein
MSRAVLIRRVLWLVAVASLLFGVWRSLQPDALDDFTRVIEWSHTLVSGASPYSGDSETDYPPWALVTVAPVTMLPAHVQPVVWVSINLLLAVVVCLSLVRLADEPREVRLGLLALLLAASCFRVLSQFSILSFTLAFVGARHPSALIGGLWLGLSLMKPQVGGVLLLAHLMMGDWRRVVTAACVPVVLTLVASAMVGVAPMPLMTDVVRVLDSVHGGSDLFAGHTELEGWLAPWIPGVTTTVGAMSIGVVLLIPVAVAAWRQHGRWTLTRTLELYALCGVVSLLATRHLSYDFLLLLPVLVAWRSAPLAVRVVAQPWRAAWYTTAVLLVVQIPGWWRRIFEPMGWPDELGVMMQLDRVLCIVLFGLLSWRLIRLDVTK